MSGQCLSPSERGHALTPRTHHCLGEPLPRQLANRTQSPPQSESHLWSKDVIWYYLRFPGAIPVLRVGNYELLSLSPLSSPLRGILARLACLIHAANVHSEPGSNPSINYSLTRKRVPRRDSSRRIDWRYSLKSLSGKQTSLSWYRPLKFARGQLPSSIQFKTG